MFRGSEDGRLVPYDPLAVAKLKLTGADAKDPAAILKAFGLDWKDVEGKLSGVSRATWFRKGKTGHP